MKKKNKTTKNRHKWFAGKFKLPIKLIEWIEKKRAQILVNIPGTHSYRRSLRLAAVRHAKDQINDFSSLTSIDDETKSILARRVRYCANSVASIFANATDIGYTIQFAGSIIVIAGILSPIITSVWLKFLNVGHDWRVHEITLLSFNLIFFWVFYYFVCMPVSLIILKKGFISRSMLTVSVGITSIFFILLLVFSFHFPTVGFFTSPISLVFQIEIIIGIIINSSGLLTIMLGQVIIWYFLKFHMQRKIINSVIINNFINILMLIEKNNSFWGTSGYKRALVRIPVKSSTESGHAVQWWREATLVRGL